MGQFCFAHRDCVLQVLLFLAGQTFSLLLDVLKEYSLPRHVSRVLPSVYFYRISSQCWNIALNHLGKTVLWAHLGVLPLCCFHQLAAPVWAARAGLGPCFSVWWSFFMSLWRSEGNQGSIYNHLRVITGCHIWVYFRNSLWNHIYKLWSTDGKVQGILLKENALHLNGLFWLLITCVLVLISVSGGHVLQVWSDHGL